MSSFIVAYLVDCENLVELLSEKAMDIEQSINKNMQTISLAALS